MRAIIVMAAAAVGLLWAAAAQAAPLSPAEQSRVAGLMLEAVDGGKAPPDPATYHPVLVIEDGLPTIADVTAFGAPVTVLSMAQARDQQRAWFVRLSHLSRLDETAEGVVLIYGSPANAQSGLITFMRDGAGWKIADSHSSHSSSGARYTYGEMYEGVTCRDGTEMAQRWSTAVRMAKAVQAGKSFQEIMDMRPAPAKCPGKEFPEVAAYRDMKAMRER